MSLAETTTTPGFRPMLRGVRVARLAGWLTWCVAASLLWSSVAVAQVVRDDFFITNGTVNAEVLSGSNLYLGGSFSFVGPVTGSGVPVDSTTGVAVSGFPKVNGPVNAVVADGAGGWYIGGAFTAVGGVARSNVARVRADLTLSPWNPAANGAVRALALDGATVYVGGDFTTVSGQPRNRIAAVDTATGAPATWNPGADNSVRAILRHGPSVFVGGLFTNIGGQARNRIAALDPVTGLATSWNPGANSGVFALAVDAGTLYAGGQFTNVGGFGRNRLVALDPVTGAVSAWNPNANNQVFALAVGTGVLYAGGQFTNVGGLPRTRLAEIDLATGFATGWNANAGNIVRALALDGPSLYVGGDFLTIGGESRSRIAELSVTTGLATAWNPAAYGIVSAIGLDGLNVFVGGVFNGIGGVPRNNAAAVNTVSGQATAWNPNPNGEVLALTAQGGVLYAGGLFSTIGGQPRSFLAALDSTLGLANAWNPGSDGQVSALALSGSIVYVGGLFANIGGAARANLAALDLGTGLASGWNPGADDQVFVLARSNGVVYAGGSFLNAGGQPRSFLAALDAATGLATAWNPGGNGTVRAIVPACDRIYVGGFFTTIGGQPRNGLVALDPGSGLASGWNPNSNGPVLGMLLHDGLVYAGGIFSQIGGVPRNRIAAIDPITALATSWNPDCNGTVRALANDGEWIYAAGSFTSIGGAPSGNLAAIQDDHSRSCPPIALTPPPLAAGVAGTAYSQPLLASGGTSPYCYRVSSGSLPAGLTLSSSTGEISGTPVAAGVSAFSVSASDARGCLGVASYTLSIFGAPSVSNVALGGPETCITPAQPCVTVPFLYTRGESAPVLAISVTFQIDASKLSLCTPGSPGASIRAGSWLGGFTNSVLQVTDHGGGSFTVDQALLGPPCGITNGGELFVVDLKAVGPDGAGAVTVTSVQARDCGNIPIAVNPGAPGAVGVLGTAIVVTPGTLPGATRGAPYSQALVASAGTPPVTFTLASGALPPGVTLAANGVVSGTPGTVGSFVFGVTATDAGGCRGTSACTLAVACPAIALTPPTLPDVVIGVPYSQAITAGAAIAPLTFAVTAGVLPPGLVLSAAGVISGTSYAGGSHGFTVGVTDAQGCTGSLAYTLAVTCPAIAVLPATLPDAVVGVPYSQALAAGAGIAPFRWSVGTGSLPAGIELDSLGGVVAGTPTTVGTRYFTVIVTDSTGCTGSRGYTMNVFASPPVSNVAADTDSLCLSSAYSCVGVPVVFNRAESTPAIGISVTFQLDVAKLALCTPGTPAASIRPGPWLAGFANTRFDVTDLGGGLYTADQVILGPPCGATGGGVLFTIDVQPVGGDGVGLITVTQVRARDCDNLPIPVSPGPAASLPIDNTVPVSISDLSASAVPAGNGTGPTTGITLAWSTGGAGTVSLYRAPFGSYPLYDALGPVTPPNPADAPGPPWTLVSANAASGLVDNAAPRGFWHYVALVTSACGVVSAPSNMTGGTLDYLLGDVVDGATAGLGDNRVRTEDVSLLGAHYGIDAATIASRGVEYLDVGPTAGGSPTGRPLPDGSLDFDDLFIFAVNYGSSVTVPQASARRAHAQVGGGTPGPDQFRVTAPSFVTAGQALTATLGVRGGGRVQAFSARLAWDADVVEPLQATSSGFVEQQGGLVLSPRPGTVDAALLGVREHGLTGEGDVATVTFRARRSGDPGIGLGTIDARDASNRPVPVDTPSPTAAPARVTETLLLAPSSNPLRGGGTLSFALSEAGPVELALFGVDGRRVRTIVNGRLEAGLHAIAWDGRDDQRRAAAPGVFFMRLSANGRRFHRTIVLLR